MPDQAVVGSDLNTGEGNPAAGLGEWSHEPIKKTLNKPSLSPSPAQAVND